jgi:hypothetical protein
MQQNGYWRFRTFSSKSRPGFVAQYLAIRRRGTHSVIGCSASGAIRASTFPPQGL